MMTRWMMAAALAAALAACDEPRPTPDASADAGHDAADADRDTADADEPAPDADPDTTWDADPDIPDAEDEAEADADPLPPMGTLTCNEDGTATVCLAEQDECTTVGPCTLGCDEEAGACYVPSNVSPELLDEGLGDLDLAGAGAAASLDTDTGQILGEGGTIRAASLGVDAATGTSFTVVAQEGGPELGVLSVGRFALPAGTTMTVSGTRALVILAAGAVTVDGVIDVGAHATKAGPGGWDGGDIGAAGTGPCGGGVGELEKTCRPFCATGGGGGGFGGAGGDGGSITWAVSDAGSGIAAGGRGGERCGTAWLTPLLGGSGGAGGTRSEEDRPQEPGPGGGGGGAIQISSAVSITVGGGITAPGDGGSETQRGGGAGGGAGGAVLLEAPALTVLPAAFIAANGGGGGGGDCT